MKDDTISRVAAIKAADSVIERDTSGNNDVVKAMTAWKEYIKVLPSAQPGWIPCSEPPMENNSYLVWMPFAPEGHHITVAEWCGSYWNIKTPITAWMPLPTPYREGGQE